MIEQSVFELGTILLKTQLREIESAEVTASNDKRKDEAIILQKTGKFWNQQNVWDRPEGLFVVTNYRLAFFSEVKWFAAEFLSFPFELIENLRTTRVVFISPGVSFEVAGERYVFTFFFGARRVVKVIERHKVKRQ